MSSSATIRTQATPAWPPRQARRSRQKGRQARSPVSRQSGAEAQAGVTVTGEPRLPVRGSARLTRAWGAVRGLLAPLRCRPSQWAGISETQARPARVPVPLSRSPSRSRVAMPVGRSIALSLHAPWRSAGLASAILDFAWHRIIGNLHPFRSHPDRSPSGYSRLSCPTTTRSPPGHRPRSGSVVSIVVVPVGQLHQVNPRHSALAAWRYLRQTPEECRRAAHPGGRPTDPKARR